MHLLKIGAWLSSSFENLKPDFQTQLNDIKVKVSQTPQQEQSVLALEEVVQKILERQKRGTNLRHASKEKILMLLVMIELMDRPVRYEAN